MNNVIKKSWRDAATLIVLCKNSGATTRYRDVCNYDILLQTRTQKASFKNSVVFPGGVTEAADASPEWLHLIKSFGYTQTDFEALHCIGTPERPLFQNNPVQRHISLRITAIRETFEELGLLICSRAHRKDKGDIWANVTPDIDVKHWQNRVAKNSEELLNLCKELNCYPDIWSLHYWNNWLTPSTLPKRFDTAFFVTALKNKPSDIKSNTEVAKVEWSTPSEILKKSTESEVVLYAPQAYELNRLEHWSDIEELIKFASTGSNLSNKLFYHAVYRAKDGSISVLPGDDLYPSNPDYSQRIIIETDKTVSELRDSAQTVHRFEMKDSKMQLALKNFSFNNTKAGEKIIPVNAIIN